MKKVQLSILTAFLLFINLGGCATNDALTKELTYSNSYLDVQENKSVISGSVTLFEGNYGWYTIKQVSTGKTQRVSVTNRSDKHSWDIDRAEGRTYWLELEPGEYEIIDWTYFIPLPSGEARLSPSNMKPIRINLKPNEAKYLGSFNFKTTYGENVFGVTIAAGVEINVTDEKKRDFDNIRKKFPNVTFDKTVKTLIPYSF